MKKLSYIVLFITIFILGHAAFSARSVEAPIENRLKGTRDTLKSALKLKIQETKQVIEDTVEVIEEQREQHYDQYIDNTIKYNYIEVGSYGANIEWGNPYDDAAFAAIIDKSGTCSAATLGSGATFYGDHAYQGFDQILYNNTLNIYDGEGNKTTYSKVGTYYQESVWLSTDGHDLYYEWIGPVVTQTCAADGSPIWVVWN